MDFELHQFAQRFQKPLAPVWGIIALLWLLAPVILLGLLFTFLAMSTRDIGTGSLTNGNVKEAAIAVVGLPVRTTRVAGLAGAGVLSGITVGSSETGTDHDAAFNTGRGLESLDRMPVSILVSSRSPVTQNTVEIVPTSVEATLRSAAAHFGVSGDQLVAVARCESGLRADAIGDHGAAVGVLQFHEPTFRANAIRYFGYSVGDMRTDVQASAVVAAWMWTRGQQAQWSCWRNLYG